MKREQILDLTKKNINLENIESIKKNLESEYNLSFGIYDSIELKKAISNKNPVIIKDHILIGYDKGNSFIDCKNETIKIDRMVKAIIVDSLLNERLPVQISYPEQQDERDLFFIDGRKEWPDFDYNYFDAVLGQLKVGEIYLPPHSAVINFLPHTKELKDKHIVSSLAGVNINIYDKENYIDNIIHEIGHLFWRDCINYDEKKAFTQLFKILPESAIYEYKWERETAEEVFCTIYKWYVKSILINKSFYNILQFEEPKGLELLLKAIDRIKNNRMASDIWNLHKAKVIEYFNPKKDAKTGMLLRKAGLQEEIRSIEIPEEILYNIERYERGVTWTKPDDKSRAIPIKNGKIYLDIPAQSLVISSEKPIIYVDLDGVVADFVSMYKTKFDRDAYKDDSFTVQQIVSQDAHFFRDLPVIEKGREIVEKLREEFEVIFLTTPMVGMSECKMDKIEWTIEAFGADSTVIFSDNKSEFVVDDSSVLIDDMEYNLNLWADAGGTAINISESIEYIFDKIYKAVYGAEDAKDVKEQFMDIEVNLNPTEKQKESGNYQKGDIIFKKIPIKIENTKGSIRFGFDESGRKWINKMNAYYGYIAIASEGADGDKVDVFIGPAYNKSLAFIINQNKADGMFDEHKIILGCNDIDEARELYLSNYQKGWESRIGSIVQSNTKKIRTWLESGNLNEPFKG